MLKVFITLFALTLVIYCFGQSEISIGDTVLINGHHIVKVAGNTITHRGYTVVEYLDQKQLIQRNKILAQSEAWNATRVKETSDYTAQNEKGGAIVLSIHRASRDNADPKWFTIVIKKVDIELLRERFASDLHPVPLDNGYWQLVSITALPSIFEFPLDVYVIDAGEDEIQFRIID